MQCRASRGGTVCSTLCVENKDDWLAKNIDGTDGNIGREARTHEAQYRRDSTGGLRLYLRSTGYRTVCPHLHCAELRDSLLLDGEDPAHRRPCRCGSHYVG